MGDCRTWDAAEWKTEEKTIQGLKSLIKVVPDFPKKGILFRDIMPIFQIPNAVTAITNVMADYIRTNHSSVQGIIGLEARGFLIGPIIAVNLGVQFIPIRKKGKLPGICISVSSTKEYGEDILEVQKDAISPNQKVVLVDDLLATGGTLEASCKLMEGAGADVLASLCLIELLELNGKNKLKKPFHSFIKY